MSAAGRGSERIAHDSYPTPAWCVHRLLEACPLPGGVWLEPCAGEGAIIDAVSAIYSSTQLNRICRGWEQAVQWAGCELRDVSTHPACRVWHHGSYLDQPFEGASVIITNPPFSLALPIAQKALTEAPYVVLLLRLNWLAAGLEDGRHEWLRKHTPDVYVLPNRPTFRASLKCIGRKNRSVAHEPCGWACSVELETPRPTQCPGCGWGRVLRSCQDATEYAWLVWGAREAMARGGIHREPLVRILAETPAAERTAHSNASKRPRTAHTDASIRSVCGEAKSLA